MYTITVGTGTCGVSAGADEVLKEFQLLLTENGITDIQLAETGCMGMCYKEVLVEIKNEENKYLYGNVTPEKAKRIFGEHMDHT